MIDVHKIVHDIVKSYDDELHDDINVTLDEDFPFPEYEMEVTWESRRWNDARTDRLDETSLQGVTVNAFDFIDEGGDLELYLSTEIEAVLITAIFDEDRVGPINVSA